MSLEYKTSHLDQLQNEQDGVPVLHVFGKTDLSRFEDIKKAHRRLNISFHSDGNTGYYKQECQLPSRVYEIVDSYIEKFIACNCFHYAEKNKSQVLLEILFFLNKMDEEIEQNVREEMKGENYDEEYNSRRKQYRARDEEVLGEYI